MISFITVDSATGAVIAAMTINEGPDIVFQQPEGTIKVVGNAVEMCQELSPGQTLVYVDEQLVVRGVAAPTSAILSQQVISQAE
jgi:hypothetical protein